MTTKSVSKQLHNLMVKFIINNSRPYRHIMSSNAQQMTIEGGVNKLIYFKHFIIVDCTPMNIVKLNRVVEQHFLQASWKLVKEWEKVNGVSQFHKTQRLIVQFTRKKNGEKRSRKLHYSINLVVTYEHNIHTQFYSSNSVLPFHLI